MDSLIEIQMFRRKLRIEGGTSTVLIPFVLPQAVLRVLSVNIGPQPDQSRSDLRHSIRIEFTGMITEERSQRSFASISRPVYFRKGFCDGDLRAVFFRRETSLPNAVNGPCLSLWKVASVAGAFFPDEAG